jgi:hypothetical protein
MVLRGFDLSMYFEFELYVLWVRAFTCIHVILVMSYMSIEFVKYSVNLRINHNMRKLTQTFQIIKKKKNT